jgi:molybdopterin converting factor small subunit
MATFKFLGYLAEAAGGRTKEVVLEESTQLDSLLPPGFPREGIIILINEKVGPIDSRINDNDSVLIMPVISGG